MNFSRKLSAEHYISRSVLEALGMEVVVDGARWLQSGERRQISVNRLTAKMLCRRHNSALSPLDTAAGELFRILRAVVENLRKRSLSRKNHFYLVSGETLELWMLKVACGLFYSKMAARNRVSLADDHVLDQQRVVDAFLLGHWDPGCGLYMRSSVGHTFTPANSVSVAPLTSQHEKRIIGARLILSGLEFQLLFDTTDANAASLMAGCAHRPSELVFENPQRRHVVVLTWTTDTPPRLIRLTQQMVRLPQATDG